MHLDWLLERFRTALTQPALIWAGREYRYAWLLDRLDHWRAELNRLGIAPGTVVALESDFSPEACALVLALLEADTVFVPLAAGAARSYARELQVAQVQVAVRCRAEADSEVTRRDVEVTHPLLVGLREAGHPGLVLFSSGSTGASKAIVHDLARLLAKYQVRRPTFRTLSFLLFDHIGGFNTLLHTLANTGTLVTVQQRDPDAVCAVIDRHRVELLPTSPTFLNLLLLSEAHARHDLSSLRRVTYGTEPMPESTLRRLREVLPQVELSQTYGLSELGILRSKSASSDSLLVKLGGEGVETKVVDGLLWIRSQSAMLGYLNAPSPFDAAGWLNTGDEVHVQGDYYRILGRRSELINVGGEKVYPAEVESVVLQAPNVADATVYAAANPITGQMVVAEVTLRSTEDPVTARKCVREYCRQHLAPFKVPAKVVVRDSPSHSARFKKLRRRE